MVETTAGVFERLGVPIGMLIIMIGALAFLAKYMLKYFDRRESEFRADLATKDADSKEREKALREDFAKHDEEHQRALKEITSHYTDFIQRTTEGYERCMSDNHASFVSLTQKYEAAFSEAERIRVEERIETQRLMTQCVAAIEKNTEVLEKVINRLDGGV